MSKMRNGVMKKSLSMLLAVGLTLGATTVVYADDPIDYTVLSEEYTLSIPADGVTGILDGGFDDLFGGDTKQAILDLVAAGAVTVNDQTLPVINEDGSYSAESFEINDGLTDGTLWLNEDQTWSWQAQILYKGENESYEDAIVDFVNGCSMLRGTSYNLTISSSEGTVTGISFSIFAVAMADTVTRGEETTTFTLYEEDGNTEIGIEFPNENVAGDPQDHEIVMYWKDSEGWHLEKCDSEVVEVNLLAYTEEGAEWYTKYHAYVGDQVVIDSRLTLTMQSSNRPTQPIYGIGWLGEKSATVRVWYCAPGVCVGISSIDAKGDLAAAIEKVQNALDTVPVSATEDGTDVDGDLWVTEYYHTTFEQAIADAQSVYDSDVSDTAYELALWYLARAYGGTTNDMFSYSGNQYFGSGSDYDTGYNGTGFMTFAQTHTYVIEE